jgi:hypothetical protein
MSKKFKEDVTYTVFKDCLGYKISKVMKFPRKFKKALRGCDLVEESTGEIAIRHNRGKTYKRAASYLKDIIERSICKMFQEKLDS